MIKFNVASINCCTEVEGPYKRLIIWFQGCDLHCKGCCNVDYQTLTPNNIVSLEELVDIVESAKQKYKIEGVTYSGGEPTMQQGLPFLTKKIQELGLGVISFTGHKYEDVKLQLEGCDVVLDGAFIESNREQHRRLLGSANQRIINLTDRYKDCIDSWFNNREKIIEINVGEKIVGNGDSLL